LLDSFEDLLSACGGFIATILSYFEESNPSPEEVLSSEF